MMRFKVGSVVLAAVSMSLVACAAPEMGSLRRSSGELSADEDDEKDDSDGSGTDGKSATPRKTAAETRPVAANAATTVAADLAPVLSVSFLGSAKQTFGGATVGRVCSDRGAEFQNATFLDGTSLSLVSVDFPDKVLATITGTALQTLKSEVVATGAFSIPVDPANLPGQPYEFAIIMGGDGRFGTPAGCGVSLKPGSTKERDVEEFPNDNNMIFGVKIGGTGCGIVGYIEAYYDQGTQKVIAKASSQLLLAADDEGRGGFPRGSSNAACDWHDSPLVLDLGNRGVSLGAPMSSVFDVDGDGTRDDSPWVVSEETPFLVRDANGNGSVDGIDEMFGNRTRGPSGLRTSENGFEALSLYDDNSDGMIDANDKVWSTLRLWFDRNHDGHTDPGELESLEARGVRSVALAFVPVKEKLWASGHEQGAVRQRGGATMTDGRVVNVVDVWFNRKPL